MSNNSIYIAGPLGFSEAGRSFLYGIVLPIAVEAGFEAIDPWTLTDKNIIEAAADMSPGEEKIEEWKKVNMIIGRNNAEAIESAGLMLAVLDGADVDSGTAAEIGYAAALKKPVIGYRNDFRLAGDNEGALVNLQVEYYIKVSGGLIINRIDDLKEVLERFKHL